MADAPDAGTAAQPTEPAAAGAGTVDASAAPSKPTGMDDEMFSNLDPTQSVTEIESYCVNCGKNVRAHATDAREGPGQDG